MTKPRLRSIVRVAIAVVGVAVTLEIALVVTYRWMEPPTTPLMIMRRAQGDGASRRWVGLHAIAPVAVQTIVVAEDRNFCRHRGVDVRAARRASGRSGASTITMQVTKNLLLWPHRDMLRQAAAYPLALLSEQVWNKRRILELYLNDAEFGRGVFGIAQAAYRYYGVTPSRLTLDQATHLAAVLPDPRHRDPRRLDEAGNRRVQQLRAAVEHADLSTFACL